MASVTVCGVCDTDLESDPNITHMNVTPIGTSGARGSFRVECSTVEDTQKWIAAFQENSKMTFRVSRTRPSSGHRVLYNYEFRCMHNTVPRSTTADLKISSKNTNCPAEMTVRLLRSEFKHKGMNSHLSDYKRKSQSKDLHLPKYPLCITLDMNHNHPIHAGDALRCRDVGPEARSKIECLLQNNHSPSSALEVLKYDLQVEHPEDYLIYAADRRHCPDLKWCYRLYYEIFHKQYGPASGSVQLEDLQHRLDEYNQFAADGTEQIFAAMVVDGEDAIVAICTPLMKRVHRLVKQSGEMVFMDAGGSMDRHNYRLFLLLTHSVAGGLPLGVLVVPSEKASTIQLALELYNRLLDSNSFYGRGLSGPIVFMTDDSKSERMAIAEVYPNAILLLCIFHVLQAHWRYLWANENGVQKDDRPFLFSVVKEMVYACSVQDLNEFFSKAVNDKTVNRYPKVKKYLQVLYERRTEWALCCRIDVPIRNNNTNNYCESAMRILKDSVLHRTKAFNIQQLVDFIVTRYDSLYQRRLQVVANNRLDYVRASRFMPAPTDINLDKIKHIAENVYEVPSGSHSDVVYTVDTFLGHCTCHQGCTGGPCKHQAAVAAVFRVQSWNILPIADPTMRQLLYQVAMGDVPVPEGWFVSLRPAGDVSSSVLDSRQGRKSSATELLDVTYARDSVPVSVTTSNSEILNRFQNAASKIQDMYKYDPVGFGPALEAFCKEAENISTASAMQSALHCFGKYVGAGKRLASLKTIGVQPTAIARRKAALGGRKRTYLGRTPRWAFAAEHGYAKRKCSRHALPAPHLLSEVVSDNVSLGRTHSLK